MHRGCRKWLSCIAWEKYNISKLKREHWRMFAYWGWHDEFRVAWLGSHGAPEVLANDTRTYGNEARHCWLQNCIFGYNKIAWVGSKIILRILSAIDYVPSVLSEVTHLNGVWDISDRSYLTELPVLRHLPGMKLRRDGSCLIFQAYDITLAIILQTHPFAAITVRSGTCSLLETMEVIVQWSSALCQQMYHMKYDW